MRHDRIKKYRLMIFDLWGRAFEPLVTRAKFWAIKGHGFGELTTHEEELVQLWKILKVRVRTPTTVFETFTRLHKVLRDKYQGNILLPVFPAEMNNALAPARTALVAERKKLYKKLKYSEKEHLEAIYTLFDLDPKADKKKNWIAQSICECFPLFLF